MARMTDIDPTLAAHLEALECHRYDDEPWVGGPPLAARRVAIISTAGLMRRGDRPFAVGDAGYRLIPGELEAADLAMSHISSNFDRTGFQQDMNVAFPLDRLRELADNGTIGSVADFHYSFMGATDPALMAPTVEHLAPLLKRNAVDAVLLAPV